MEFLRSLIIVSEKAANVARVIRKHEHLFELLVQKKKNSEANPRFVEDFKTLADVLIQEMVKHDLQKQVKNIKFPFLTSTPMSYRGIGAYILKHENIDSSTPFNSLYIISIVNIKQLDA